MTTPTTNFAWGKPIIGASSSTWGAELNAIFDSQDTLLGAVVSATGNLVTPGGTSYAGNAWTTSGLRFIAKSATYTDNSTAGSGTVTTAYVDAHKAPTVAAKNSSVTYTNLYSLYVEAPVAGTNVTVTNGYALGADSLAVNGAAAVTGTLTAAKIVKGTFSGISAPNGTAVPLFTIPSSDGDGIYNVVAHWGTGVGVAGQIAVANGGAAILDQNYMYSSFAQSGTLSLSGSGAGPWSVQVTQSSGSTQTYAGQYSKT